MPEAGIMMTVSERERERGKVIDFQAQTPSNSLTPQNPHAVAPSQHRSKYASFNSKVIDKTENTNLV